MLSERIREMIDIVKEDVSLINSDNSVHDNSQEDVVNCDNIVESDLANYAPDSESEE